MNENSVIEKLIAFVNKADDYAFMTHNCTIKILQEYPDENYVVIGFYTADLHTMKDDPAIICTLKYIEADILFNCNFCLKIYNDSHALIKNPTHLFKLLRFKDK